MWKLHEVVLLTLGAEEASVPFTVVDLKPGKRGRGLLRAVVTEDGKPAHLNARCTCAVVTDTAQAADLVTETLITLCGRCRMPTRENTP